MSEAREMLPDSKICEECGKEFTVLFPDMWRFCRVKDGRGRVYMCSWKCLREWDREKSLHKKEAKEQRQIQKELNEGADELAGKAHRRPEDVCRAALAAMDRGEDIREYLKGIGYANPSDMLTKLKRWSEKNDPEAAKRLAEVKGLKKGPPKGTRPSAKTVQARKAAREKKAEPVDYTKAAAPETGTEMISRAELMRMMDECALKCQKSPDMVMPGNDGHVILARAAMVAAHNRGVMAMRDEMIFALGVKKE